MKKILIGSCGGLTGVYLAKQLKKTKDVVIYGCDANGNSVGKFFVEKLFVLSKATDTCFLEELIQIIDSNDIDIYIPTHSKEIYVISKFEKELRERCEIQFIVSPFETFKALDDKESAYKCLSEIGLSVPKIIYSSKDIRCFPIMYKKKWGSGGIGKGIIMNIQEFEQVKKSKEDILFCEYLQGEEYTIDCMFSDTGKLLGYNQRRRKKCIGGAVSITCNENPIDILPYINKISEKWIIKGCVNFQYILCDDTPYFIDINLRYASGGLPLSVESGVDIISAMLKIFNGEKIEEGEFSSDFHNRTMYRYFEEKYEDDSIN